jgi:hypothetical protein
MPGVCLSNPLDVVKTKLAVEPTTIRDAVRRVYHENGVRGFYRGLGMRLLRVAPGMGITWTVVDEVVKSPHD